MAWWEAGVLFLLWGIQFALSPVSTVIHVYITIAYYVWSGIELIRILIGHRKPVAFVVFRDVLLKRSSAPSIHIEGQP